MYTHMYALFMLQSAGQDVYTLVLDPVIYLSLQQRLT